MKVAILGNGGFGTAMAIALSRGGREVSLWGHDAEYTAEIARTRRNPRYLESAELPGGVQIGSELGPAVAGAGAVLVAVPAQHVRSVVGGHRGELANVPLVSLAKGLEQGTSLRPSQVIAECVGHGERVLALSGPSHAEEIAQGLPTTVVLAGKDDHLLRALQEILNVPGLRTYRNHDLLGVELCGALKNVIALAAGIADGLGYGDNAKAAILARGIVEMVRFGKQSGADERTFYGLAGVGDLAVTAFSRHGRNRAFGERLGRGETMAAILASTQKIAEGVFTAKVAVSMARQLHVDMPLCFAVDQVLHHGLAPATAVRKLMERDPKAEG